MQVSKLKDQELEKYLNHLFSVERKTTAQILECLLELSRRRMYLELGYTSLFAYLSGHYGHPPSTAQRWIDTVRMMSAHPEIKENIQSGELNLTQVSILAQNLREKKKEDPKACFKEKELIESIKNQTVAQTQVILAKSLDLEIKTYEKKKLQQDESVRIEITLKKEQVLELERAKDLLSHQFPNLSMSELISKLAQEFLKRKDPRRPTSRRKSNSRMAVSFVEVVSPEVISSENVAGLREQTSDKNQERNLPRAAKAVPRQIHRVVHQRDQGCQWPLRKQGQATGQKCGSKFQLQIDHIQPRWAGGENDIENLQLLCGIHNREKYQRESYIKRRHPSGDASPS